METSSARFGRRSVPAGADAGRFGSPVLGWALLSDGPEPFERLAGIEGHRTEPVPDSSGNGPKERKQRCDTRKTMSASPPAGRNRPTPGLRCSGRARLLQRRVSPQHIPAGRLCRTATDGKRRLPVRRLRQGRPLSRKCQVAVRPSSGPEGGASRLRPPPSRVGDVAGRALDLTVRQPSQMCQWSLLDRLPPPVVVSTAGSRERTPPAGPPVGWTRPESGHSLRLRWGDPEPRDGPDPPRSGAGGPVRGSDGGADRSRSRAWPVTAGGTVRGAAGECGRSSRGPDDAKVKECGPRARGSNRTPVRTVAGKKFRRGDRKSVV